MWLQFIAILLDNNLKASYDKYISLYLKIVKRDKFKSDELAKFFSPNLFGERKFLIDRFNKIQPHLNIRDILYDSMFKYCEDGRDFINYIYSKLTDDDFNVTNLKFLFMNTGEFDYDRLFRLVETNKINFYDIFFNFDIDYLLIDSKKIIEFFRDTSREKYLWVGGAIFEVLLKNITAIKGDKIEELIKLLAFIVKKSLNNINKEPVPQLKNKKEKLFKDAFMRILSHLFSMNHAVSKIGSLPFKRINTIFEKINQNKVQLQTLEEQTAYESKFIDLIAVQTNFKQFLRSHHITPGILSSLQEPIKIQIERLMENIHLNWSNIVDFQEKYLKYKNKYLLLKKLKI
jgi:hypothetical protein